MVIALIWLAFGSVLASGIVSIFRISAPIPSEGITFVAIVGLLASFLFLAELQRGLTERLSEGRPILRLTPFLLFACLGVCSALLCVVAAHGLVRLWFGQDVAPLSPTSFALSHVIAPGLSPLLFVLLSAKVRSVRTLDDQKQNLRAIARSLNRFRLPIWPFPSVGNTSNPVSDADFARYRKLLEETCLVALKVASTTGQNNNSNGSTGVLFLADQKARAFTRIATANASREHEEALETFKPAFWDVGEFRKTYNSFVGLAQQKKQNKDDLLAKFRQQTARIVSMTGIVYATEAQLAFDRKKYALVFRDELFAAIPPEIRPVFRQVVGIPIFVYRRKLGVFLMLSARDHSFYPHDSVYWIISDLIGSCCKLGMTLGYFDHVGLTDAYQAAPEPDAPTRIEEIRSILNEIRGDFSQTC